MYVLPLVSILVYTGAYWYILMYILVYVGVYCCFLSCSVLCMYCLWCRYCQYWHQLSPEPDEKVREKVEKGKYLEEKDFSILCDCIISVFLYFVWLYFGVGCILCDCGEKMVVLLSRTNGDSSGPKEFIECALHWTKYEQTNKQTNITIHQILTNKQILNTIQNMNKQTKK